MLALSNALAQCSEHPRLADAGRTRQHHHLAFASGGQSPAVKQKANLVLAADECSQSSAVGRLEPARHGALCQNTPDRNRLCKTLQDLIVDLVQLEYVAHQGPGRSINQHRARLGSTLQAGSQVGRLTGYRLGIEATAAYQIADNDLAGRDADPGPQVLAVATFDLGHRCNGLEAGPHRTLTVVL